MSLWDLVAGAESKDGLAGASMPEAGVSGRTSYCWSYSIQTCVGESCTRMTLFSSVESDKARQVREAIDDFGTSNPTKLELRRSHQNQPETRANA